MQQIIPSMHAWFPGTTERTREPAIKYDTVLRQSTAGVIPRAKLKTIKMTFVIVLGTST